MSKSKILVTGGLGYIGSQTVLSLLDSGFEVVILDKNQPKEYQNFAYIVDFERVDLLNIGDLERVFKKYKIEVVIHFAAFIEVGESQLKPEKYYKNNVVGTLNLLTIMHRYKVNKIVFSSTAAVYGFSGVELIDENQPRNPISVYGRTKSISEDIINDFCKIHGFSAFSLRYFNACGADPQTRTGEDHNPETHLIPCILNAIANNVTFKIFGNNYNTPDGTCIRDYIHTTDLASAHILATKYLMDLTTSGFYEVVNLGTGQGFSVSQIVQSVEQVTGCKVLVEFVDRRPGDSDRLVASNQKAKKILNWEPQSNLYQIIKTAWEWYQKIKLK